MSQLWVVAGAPGAGKSTVAGQLAGWLDPPAAVLDKDALFGPLVAELLRAHDRSHGEREGPWYDEHVKRHEYAGMAAGAAQIRQSGCPVVLVAPFTDQQRDPAAWADLVAAAGGEPARLLWVHCDPDTLHRRLTARGRARDAGKLADFARFAARVGPDRPPAVPHLPIDVRDGAAPVRNQLERLGVTLAQRPGFGC